MNLWSSSWRTVLSMSRDIWVWLKCIKTNVQICLVNWIWDVEWVCFFSPSGWLVKSWTRAERDLQFLRIFGWVTYFCLNKMMNGALAICSWGRSLLDEAYSFLIILWWYLNMLRWIGNHLIEIQFWQGKEWRPSTIFSAKDVQT